MRSSVDEAQKPVNELAILSPSEVQEFRQQVAQELAEEERKKSMSKEHFGPRAVRSGSLVKRGGSTVHTERPAVKIRPSLAPSFVGASSPPRSEPRTSPPRPTNESSKLVISVNSCLGELTRLSHSCEPLLGDVRLHNESRQSLPSRTPSHPDRESAENTAETTE